MVEDLPNHVMEDKRLGDFERKCLRGTHGNSQARQIAMDPS